MARVIAAFADGWGRVLRAPAILLGVFAVTWLVAFPAGRLLDQQQAAPPEGVGMTAAIDRAFTPALFEAGAYVLELRKFLADGLVPVALAAVTATALLVWTFLLGGIIDRYARRRPTRAQAFFGASGVFFFRFLRLAVIAAIGYAVLFLLTPGWLLPSSTPRPVDAATAAPFQRLLLPLQAVLAFAVAFWSAVFDYARVRAVVEDRRSMLGAFLAGWRFVTLHPLKTLGLYLLNGAVLGVLIAASVFAFPSTAGAGAGGITAFAAAGLYLLARVALKLVFFASQTALFQRSLAHAEYTAAPTLLWPESPAAEGIANAGPGAT
jgi:hypothetical protein